MGGQQFTSHQEPNLNTPHVHVQFTNNGKLKKRFNTFEFRYLLFQHPSSPS